MADDLGYGELGCYGQREIQTPHLDRMASEGLRFTQFYAGATVCAPSRSVLMTGQHHGHTRVRGNAGPANPRAQALRADDVTVAKLLEEAGYATALIGKWGLGDVGAAESGLPRRHGFDYFFGFLNQHHAHNHYPDYLWRNGPAPSAEQSRSWVTTRRRMPDAVLYTDDLFADEASNLSPAIPRNLLPLESGDPAREQRAKSSTERRRTRDYGPAPRRTGRFRTSHAAMITRLWIRRRLLDQLTLLGLARNTW
jgi:arylsulfatase A-like enzyme